MHALHLWLTVRRAEDVPGEWVAHCLDVDVFSQGRSPSHALSMVSEAIGMVVAEDLANNRDPGERSAPEEEWDNMYASLQGATALPDVDALDVYGETESDCFIIQLKIMPILPRQSRPAPYEPKVGWRKVRSRTLQPLHA